MLVPVMKKYAFVRLLCHDSLHLLREGENHPQHHRSGATLPGSVPDPPDPRVFGAPGSISQRYGSGSFYHKANIVRKTLISTVM